MKLSYLLRYSFIFVLLAILIRFSMMYPDSIWNSLENLQQLKHRHEILAPLAFMGLYLAIAAFLVLPVAPLTLLGGWLFGPLLGALYTMLGATLSAIFAFLIARKVAKQWVIRHLGERLNQIRNGVSREGWRFVALLRLLPILPFNVINGALGLTDIRFRSYLLTTFICMLPSKLVYSYVGSLGIAFIRHPSDNLFIKVVLAISLLIVGVCLPAILKRILHTPT